MPTDDVKGNEHETRNRGISYKDRLVGAIPGAFEQAFGFESFMQEDIVSDDEEEQEQMGCTRVCFSKEEKTQMRDPWKKASIIKTSGRRLGFSFLVEEIRNMWKPTGNMDCIDLGFDFFLVKFELAIDVDYILKGGPWFIGQHFLAIRQWEPKFKASTATLSSVAVWIRLPKLPIEFYETKALHKIGRAIGPVLCIDAHTAIGVRGRFARLCVQVNLEKPLLRTIHIGKIVLSIQYKGINALCFSCGRIGYKVETCPHVVREYATGPNMETNASTGETPNGQMAVEKETEKNKLKDYGYWMVVNRQKPKGRWANKLQQPEQSQTSEASPVASFIAMPRVAKQYKRDYKRKATHTQFTTSRREADKTAESNQHRENLGKGVKSDDFHAKTNQRAKGVVTINEATWTRGKKKGPFLFWAEPRNSK